MHAAPASPHLNRMLQVKHLVIDDVLNHKAGNPWMIEHPTDDNGVVRGVVVAEAITRSLTAPTHPRTCQQPVKKLDIEFLENRLKIVG